MSHGSPEKTGPPVQLSGSSARPCFVEKQIGLNKMHRLIKIAFQEERVGKKKKENMLGE